MLGEPRAPLRGHLRAARLGGLVARGVVHLAREIDELADARAVAIAALGERRVVGPDLVEEDRHRVLRGDVRRRRQLDDPGTEPLDGAASGLQAVEDVGLDAARLGAPGDGDAQPFERARPAARRAVAVAAMTGSGSRPGSVASARSSAAASATLRAIGPGWSSVGLSGMQPSAPTRP